MSDLPSNKKVVEAFISDLNNSGMAQAIRNHLTETARWIAVDFGESSRGEMITVAEGLSDIFERQISIQLGILTAEEDRVCAEAKSFGQLKDGRIYKNDYHFLFRLADGKITEVHEHSNTRHVHEMFDPVFGGQN